MEQAVVFDEAKNCNASNVVQEAVQEQEPPKLEPLLTFSCSIPEGWKDAIYGKDGTGSASADNDWPESMASGKARE